MLKFSVEYPKIGVCYISHPGSGVSQLVFESDDEFLLNWLKGDLDKTYDYRGFPYSEACTPRDLTSYLRSLPEKWKIAPIEGNPDMTEPPIPDDAIP